MQIPSDGGSPQSHEIENAPDPPDAGTVADAGDTSKPLHVPSTVSCAAAAPGTESRTRPLPPPTLYDTTLRFASRCPLSLPRPPPGAPTSAPHGAGGRPPDRDIRRY